MNLFIQHPQEQGISYLDHLQFATGIACRLFMTVVAFFVHAFFPFIGINRSLDLEQTAGYIQERNAWIENAKLQKSTFPGQEILESGV